MENKQMLTKDSALSEVWCVNNPETKNVLLEMGNFELEEQTDEYEIYKTEDVLTWMGSFKIKVFRDKDVPLNSFSHLATSNVQQTNAQGDQVPEIIVFEVVEDYDTYRLCAWVDEDKSLAFVNGDIDNNVVSDEKPSAEAGSEISANTPLKGFAAVAGMEDLKREMLDEVKWIIDNKDKAERYGLHLPNGMLLFGYPGCGKTYFAEKLAEELGVKFMFKRGSELGSHWMHQTEQNIGELFSTAKQQAPCIVCIDEIDGFLPYRRDGEGADSALLNAEVNEFLSQMNNCGKDGVMVIGTTNNPALIDPALLRTGRMDKLVYVPLPDVEAREAMLKLLSRNIPCEDDIDYKAISEACDGMVMSDIECLLHRVVMKCAREDSKLSTDILTVAAKDARRSVYIPKEEDNQEQQVQQPRSATKIIGFGKVS